MDLLKNIHKPAAIRCIFLLLFFGLVFILCWINGMAEIVDWHGPGSTLSNEFYVPAIMISAGYGFNLVDVHEVPGLRAFLDLQTTTFDPTAIPENIELKSPHPVHVYHKNLIYLAALTWRLLGISWDAIKVLLIILLFLCAVLVYGISRLALPRIWSCIVVAAFVLNDGVLMALYHLRDFSKAPFVLLVFGLLCIAVKHRLCRRHYLTIALLIGCTLGIGMGFRRDMLALLPLSVAVLASCRIRQTPYPHLIRVAAALLVVSSFTVLGWTALHALYPERGINAHDMIMGFSSRTDAEAGVIIPASYEKHFLLDDNYSTYQAFLTAELGFSVDSDDYHKKRYAIEWLEYDYFLKRQYVLYIARTFPADMLTRSYAAVLRITTGIFRNIFRPFIWLEMLAVPLMIITFLVLAAQDPYRAWQLVLLICFFCGYTSFQFSQRHAFHMTFVGYLSSLFALYCLAQGLRTLYAQGNVRKIMLAIYEQRRKCLIAGIWLLVTFAAFYVPLRMARVVQAHTVRGLFDAYRQAERQPLQHRTLWWEGRTLFVPEDNFPCHHCEIEQDSYWWFRARVLAARFKPGDDLPAPVLMYEWDLPGPEFTGPVSVYLLPGIEAGYIDYYFPVYTTTICDDWDRFAGMLISDHQADRFDGFYEITDIISLGGLFGMIIPENEDAFACAQRLHIPWPHTFPSDYSPGNPPYYFQEDGAIKHLLRLGDLEAAAQLAEAMLKRRPDSIQFSALLIEALLMDGNEQRAHKIIDNLCEVWANDHALYARLERCFERVGGTEARYSNWQRLAATGDECAQNYMERAQIELSASEQYDTLEGDQTTAAFIKRE